MDDDDIECVSSARQFRCSPFRAPQRDLRLLVVVSNSGEPRGDHKISIPLL